MDSPNKKRNRIPTSCLVCRKRKSKCDRTRPVCGTCKKKLIAHLCNYEDESPNLGPGNTTYLPMSAAPPLSVHFGQPMNPSPHLSNPPTFHAPPPPGQLPHGVPGTLGGASGGIPGQVFPLPGLWAASKTGYFEVPHKQANQAHDQTHTPPSVLKSFNLNVSVNGNAKIPGPGHTSLGQTLQTQQNHQAQNHQAGPNYQAPQNHQTSQNHRSPQNHQITQNHHTPLASQSYKSNHQNIPSIHANYTHLQLQQPQQQVSPVFQYYQPRDSVSSGSSLHSRVPELAPLAPIRAKLILSVTSQLLLPDDNANTTLPPPKVPLSFLANPQITPAALSASSSLLPAGSVAMQHTEPTIVIQPHVMPSIDLSPAATLSLASSLAMAPTVLKTTGPQPHSIDELAFRLPQKRAFSQRATDDSGPNFVTVTIGSNVLRIDADDAMDSFSGASHAMLVEGSYWQQQGPISYVGLTKSDPYIKLLRTFTLELFKSDQFSKFILVRRRRQALMNGSPSSHSITASSASDDRSEYSEHSSHLDDANEEQGGSDSEVDIETEGGLVVTAILAAPNTDPPVGSLPAQFPTIRGIQSLKSIYSSKEEYYSFVKVSVLEILPRKRAVQLALQRFFRYVLPFVPILDEGTFLAELDVVFNNSYEDDSDGFYSLLKIRNDNHLNVVGQLLLMTRLGYMSLIPNNENDVAYTSREQELIKDITRFKSDQYISIVNLCIAEEKIQTKSTFKFVQALTLLHFYRSVAPNDCHGLSGSDSQLLFGAIVTHALSIGLNRDPTKFYDINSISKKPGFVKQWRSLWHYICNVDALQAMYCGTPLKIPSLDISDVKKPDIFFVNAENYDFYDQRSTMLESYRRIINMVTNLRVKPKVIEVLQETSQLENLFLEIFGTDFFRDYVCKPAVEQNDLHGTFDQLKHEESFTKVNRFVCFMHMRANLSCLYYLIALHYEHRLDQDKNAEIGPGIELFKVFIRSVIQLVYIMSYALDNSQELFGRSYDYVVTSRIEQSMIKTHSFVTSFFIRLVNYKRSLAVEEDKTNGSGYQGGVEDFDARCEVVDSLFTIALIEAELFVGHFRVLSKTYINSYKLYVMAYFVLKQCMENPEKLFGTSGDKMDYFHEGTNMLQFLKIPELQSLCKLFEEFRVAKLELIQRQKTHSKTAKADPLQKADSNKPDDSFGFKDPSKGSDADAFDAIIGGTVDIVSSFDVSTANREMYANANTINTYGILLEKHMHSDFLKEVFDEQSMIGNEELLKLFELYGDLDTMA